MLRFILERKRKDVSGCEYREIQTLDLACPELEAKLTTGGLGADSYDITQLIGVELRDEDQS